MDSLDGLNNLKRNMNELYASGSFSDVTLVVNGTKFKAHKMILAGQSPYFEALLFGIFKKSLQNEVELREISVKAFEGILKYLYAVPLSLGDYMKDGEVTNIFVTNIFYFWC